MVLLPKTAFNSSYCAILSLIFFFETLSFLKLTKIIRIIIICAVKLAATLHLAEGTALQLLSLHTVQKTSADAMDNRHHRKTRKVAMVTGSCAAYQVKTIQVTVAAKMMIC